MPETFTTIEGRQIPICSDCDSACDPERFYSAEASYWSDEDEGAFPRSPFYAAFLCVGCFSRIGTRVGATG